MHKRIVILSFAAIVLASLAGCASLPRSIDISQQQIEAALARKFPVEARAGDLFSVKLGVPRLTLLPQSNRMRLQMAIEASDTIAHNAIHGDAAVSFGVRYEASDATLRMTSVSVEQFELRGLPARWQRRIETAGIAAAEQLLEGAALHQFRPDQVERARGWTPGEIRVTNTGVRVELRPPSP